MITFERNGRKLTAIAANGTKLHIDMGSNVVRPEWAFVSAPGFGTSALYNCALRSVGDMRALFRKLAVADFVTTANARMR